MSKHLLISLFAMGFGTGLLKPAPGTWGSLLAAIIFVVLLQWYAFDFLLFWVIFTFVGGIWLCDQFIVDDKHHDPGEVVWDEMVGFWFACLFLPGDMSADAFVLWIVLIFVLFRIFDIAKPFPINRIDLHVTGGLGIMLDDIVAGLFAGVLSWILYRIYYGLPLDMSTVFLH